MREEIFEGTYLSVFSENGVIEAGHSDGVGFVGTTTEDELKVLYDMLYEHFQAKAEHEHNCKMDEDPYYAAAFKKHQKQLGIDKYGVKGE